MMPNILPHLGKIAEMRAIFMRRASNSKGGRVHVVQWQRHVPEWNHTNMRVAVVFHHVKDIVVAPVKFYVTK
jgi:hypothetical protein